MVIEKGNKKVKEDREGHGLRWRWCISSSTETKQRDRRHIKP